MRIAAGLDVDDLPDGGVRVRARDWPYAAWLAVPALVTGLPLVAWSAATGRWIELGGGLVFLAFGGVLARLALAERRDVVIRGRTVTGSRGAGPFAAQVELSWTTDVAVELRPFAVPEGAPDLPDRGGDLVLAAAGTEFRLARRSGPCWRAELERARERVAPSLARG